METALGISGGGVSVHIASWHSRWILDCSSVDSVATALGSSSADDDGEVWPQVVWRAWLFGLKVSQLGLDWEGRDGLGFVTSSSEPVKVSHFWFWFWAFNLIGSLVIKVWLDWVFMAQIEIIFSSEVLCFHLPLVGTH